MTIERTFESGQADAELGPEYEAYLDKCEAEEEWEEEYEDDGQPSEYEEWQDYFGGDDSEYGTYGDY